MPNKVTHYELTPKAFEDLEDIWRYSAEAWSPEQADHYIDDLSRSFDMLVAMPTLARERSEFTPAVRIHPHMQHLVVYVLADKVILILRILGGKQNWRALLERLA